MKNLAIFALAIVLLASCGGDAKKQAEVAKLKAEVETLHNTVMAQTGQIQGMRNKLDKKIQSLLANADTTKAEALKLVSEKLQTSEDDMMSWMKDFNGEMEGSAEEVSKYLSEQKSKMEEIQKSTTDAISNAQTSLSENAGTVVDEMKEKTTTAVDEATEKVKEEAGKAIEKGKEKLKELTH